MDAKFYFLPPGHGSDGPLDQGWRMGWEVELRDGQRFGDHVTEMFPLDIDPVVLSLVDGLFRQAIQVVAQLHTSGHDLALRTIEYEDAKYEALAARAHAEV